MTGVIDDFGFVGDVRDYLIETACVPVTCRSVPLGSGFVSISSPPGKECSQVAVVWVERDTVVTVPRIEYRLKHIGWDRTCLVEWRRRVMRFASGVVIQGLEVNGSSGVPILFGTYDHLVAPSKMDAARVMNGWGFDGCRVQRSSRLLYKWWSSTMRRGRLLEIAHSWYEFPSSAWNTAPAPSSLPLLRQTVLRWLWPYDRHV